MADLISIHVYVNTEYIHKVKITCLMISEKAIVSTRLSVRRKRTAASSL